MGAIQNAANQLAQTGLGAAVAGKHLKQQEESIKQQEDTKKLTGLNTASIIQGKLDDNLIEAEKATDEAGAGIKELSDKAAAYSKESEKAYAAGANIFERDERGRGRDAMGKYYSFKQLDAAETAAWNVMAEVEAKVQNQSRIFRQRDLLKKQADMANDIYGTNIIADNMSAGVKEIATEINKSAHESAKNMREQILKHAANRTTEQGGKK